MPLETAGIAKKKEGGMGINRRDLITIIVLSMIFFSIAIWDLGLAQAPSTTWKATENKTFYFGLGEPANVSSVYFLVKNGSANIQVYTGSLESWSPSGNLNISSSYYSWNEAIINRLTQNIRIDFHKETSIQVAEIAVLNSDNQQITITTITSEDASDPNLPKLIDEQNLVQLPPTYMGETIFDEVYFVRTAEQYLNLQIPFEWTHPSLGKLIIASGITVFGYNPFGWRIMGVIFATLMIPLIYFLGKKLFETWIGGFASAFLLTFDFMHFTMARMATVDTYLVFFSLASQLFFLIYLKDVLKKGWNAPVLPLFLSILFFALGFSTKWVVFYGLVAQLVILAALRYKEVVTLKKSLLEKVDAFLEHPFFQIVVFLFVGVVVYFLIYVPDLLAGRSAVDVFWLQGSMFEYHSTLSATHPFSSSWWSWPLMLKPLWLYVSYLPLNMKSTIVLLGNPALWWIGFACVIVALERVVRKRDFVCTFITAFFFFQWLPYLLISRITFIYHFYVNVPFLCLVATYFINKFWGTKLGKIVSIIYFASLVVMFALFYSIITGTPAPASWIDSLKWFGGWIF
jgi:dolichyl-phosphate-mannose-protein mannosyltransferase